MSDAVALSLLVAGLLLFVAGDLIWLVRVTLSRPMYTRLAGGLIVSGVALIAVGLAIVGTSQ